MIPVGQNLYEGTITLAMTRPRTSSFGPRALRLVQGNSALKVPTVDVYEGWLEAKYHF